MNYLISEAATTWYPTLTTLPFESRSATSRISPSATAICVVPEVRLVPSYASPYFASVEGFFTYLNADVADSVTVMTVFPLVAACAAEGLCLWIHNMIAYHQIEKDVRPKRMRAATAQAELEKAQAELKVIEAMLKSDGFNDKEIVIDKKED